MSSEQPTSPDAGGEKKLIIDEDWKSQVEAEKAAAEATRTAAAPPGAASPAAAASPPGGKPTTAGKQSAPLPPANLSNLVTMLATQAMVSLGALPNPLTRQVETDLPQARHFVDLLEMLEAKTRGNTTAEETRLFDGILHELRMACVQMKT